MQSRVLPLGFRVQGVDSVFEPETHRPNITKRKEGVAEGVVCAGHTPCGGDVALDAHLHNTKSIRAAKWAAPVKQ